MANRRSSSPSGPSRRRSNHDRAQWRDICRGDLARHIGTSSLLGCSGSMAHTSGPAQQLGLDVDPADVRLVSGPADPYAWRYGLEQEHLFRRQFSKHNVSAYRQICQHLGHAIQAVLHDGQPVRSSTPRDVDSGERSRLPPSRSARSPPSHGCGDGEPGHTTREVSESAFVTTKLIRSLAALD